MAELASLQAIVQGSVQGVYYRAFASWQARKIGLTGYARNQPDGSVEVVAEGERKKLEELVGYLKIGPPGAKVDKVVANWSDHTGKYPSFNVRY